jgi:nucleoside 2-deoxyribosyltransferase
MLEFPRIKRPGWQVRYPNFKPDESAAMLYYAFYKAAQRWEKAIAEQDLSTLDSIDFIIATIDKAQEM